MPPGAIQMEGMPPGAMQMEGMPPMPSMTASSGSFELIYNYQKPVLIKGYIIETANDNSDSDPKDWVV